MKNVLIINHIINACGVQSFGKRVYDLVKESKSVKYSYREIDNQMDYYSSIRKYSPDFIVYNWHRGTMPWLSEKMILQERGPKHYFIFHEEFTRENYDKYLFFGAYDFSGGVKFGDRKSLLPRPLFNYRGEYPKNDTITIGSFGFGFWNKGYVELARLVNSAFDNANLNFHMPYSHFGDPLHHQGDEVEEACIKEITKPGINLNITHDFLNEEGVLRFLAGNDINAFMYKENGEGISSVVDFALSVKRPIALSKSRMFRHIPVDNIRLENSTITDILSRGTEDLESLYNEWSPRRFQEKFDEEFV